MPDYLLHHRLHAIQRAQQLYGLSCRVIQHSGGGIRICRLVCSRCPARPPLWLWPHLAMRGAG